MAEDSRIYMELWGNMELVEREGKTREEVKYIYRNNPHGTCKADNSNKNKAKRRTDALIRKLKKENKLIEFQEQGNGKVDIGTLVEIKGEKMDKTLKVTHNFCIIKPDINSNWNVEDTDLQAETELS